MSVVHLVCGATGAGKTTYAIALASRERALRLSIDPWMQTLFGPDQGELSFEWMMERVRRCEDLMWQMASQLLGHAVPVVLDLGFTTRAQRDQHRSLAAQHGAKVQLHYLELGTDLRRERVRRRNAQRDPAVFAFEVNEQMFDFMEPRFEPPDAEELAGGVHVRE